MAPPPALDLTTLFEVIYNACECHCDHPGRCWFSNRRQKLVHSAADDTPHHWPRLQTLYGSDLPLESAKPATPKQIWALLNHAPDATGSY